MAIRLLSSPEWYHIHITTSKKLELECQRYVTNKWSFNPSQPLRKGYSILWSARFPEVSRDRYSDHGYYIELIGIGNVPLVVAEWEWREDSSHAWDYRLMLPDRVYTLRTYVDLRRNEMDLSNPRHYTADTHIGERMERNHDDDHLYAFRKVMEFVHAKCLLS